MFQFPACPLPSLYIQLRVPGHYSRWVAPFGNPRIKRLLAATRGLSQQRYVLHRLLVPRHPPCALSSLTFLSSLDNERSCRAFGMRDEHERYRSAREDASPRRLNDAHRLGKCAGWYVRPTWRHADL